MLVQTKYEKYAPQAKRLIHVSKIHGKISQFQDIDEMTKALLTFIARIGIVAVSVEFILQLTIGGDSRE